eukprot:g2894.t1
MTDEEPKRKRMKTGDEEDKEEKKQPVLTFRNHRPVTESLGKNQVPVKTAPSIAIAKELEEKVKAEIQNKPSTLNLAPQKPDADLKRDVEKKLRKLARRTQRAIRELIQEKLEAEQNGEYDGVTGDAADQLD